MAEEFTKIPFSKLAKPQKFGTFRLNGLVYAFREKENPNATPLPGIKSPDTKHQQKHLFSFPEKKEIRGGLNKAEPLPSIGCSVTDRTSATPVTETTRVTQSPFKSGPVSPGQVVPLLEEREKDYNKQIRDLEKANEIILRDFKELYDENLSVRKLLGTGTDEIAVDAYSTVNNSRHSLWEEEMRQKQTISQLHDNIRDQQKTRDLLLLENKQLQQKVQSLKDGIREFTCDSKRAAIEKKIQDKKKSNAAKSAELGVLKQLKEELQKEISSIKDLISELTNKAEGINKDLHFQKTVYSSRHEQQ